ncbi:exodeoxyribonuclease VII large subunit [Thalassobacter stenotrophicus]|uniref:Exodeoxyribonuclease 7 large subunit n=2 Tax=Thalassobacter stenotrophicus TaxID=266809 RepID=A0A0P1F3E7_9RHOB|nr:exodeoxyribonuclease VII large subunit [Thalassobacter stenotrophicus]PVZ48838.1 exodeoxyribonuclease VII large subunit [Thalassobacter stenotrophicus]CUH62195.1 Exodeoxyribonuclease 7 large subunit [Thalassobacter stenotrophicus]SHI32755.1 Exodeoxyribonuclease VII large subunit [Thalassobacter stenotrophicus DSM 16310]
MDLLDDDPTGDPNGSNAPEFTVSELSGAVKRTLEGEFGRIRVRGEVGRVVRARSGHIYYDVKDDRNTLACTTWKGQAARLSVQPEEGMEVIVTGRLTAYGAQSKYNMNVEELEVAGAGALMAMLEKRKQQLTAEGLFAPERKKPLPYLPEVIGVVTSPSGAVIRDILHRLRDRFPRRVIIWPVAVQGKPCAPEVANAIRGFNAMPEGAPTPDLIIVARGGGSIEDLWGFNEEIVVRAAAESRIPLISAVGHETDTTLIDYAADQRAPTPTAAAEMAVPVRLDLMGWVDQQGARMTQTLRMGLRQRTQRATDLARALPRPDTLLSQPRQRLDLSSERLPNALRARTNAGRMALSRLEGRMTPNTLRAALRTQDQRLQTATARLAPRAQSQVAALRAKLDSLERMRLSLGYEETLKRGYAVVWGDDAVVTSHKALKSVETVEIEFADGRKPVTPTTPKKPKQKIAPPDQGSLF